MEHGESQTSLHSTANRIRLVQGDITQLQVDAIVNAANQALAGGGGVDGAIHRAAGPELLAACKKVAPCPTGQARMTPGFRLSAPYVIHTVGPIYEDGTQGEPELLHACYESSLKLAREYGLKHIAFPCISTGVYGYPPDEACQIAVRTVLASLENHDIPHIVTFCCFLSSDWERYAELLDQLGLFSR
jgi:O-acetyl-ADP-ribose deacetylase